MDMDLTTLIAKEGDALVTDSRAVALAFGKRHKNVLRAIESALHSRHAEIAEHGRLNFEPTMYAVPGPKGASRMEPMYRMTAKGLSELAMGFTGDQSRVIRIRFLNAFEAVADRLAERERSITERLFELERRELPSVVKGQVGSQLMNERRREKPEFAAQRSALESLQNPQLPLH